MFDGRVVRTEEPRGFHDLEALSGEVLRNYFPGQGSLPIRWGQRIQRKKRRSIRLGSYNHQTREIRIHPLLDSPYVPPFFIQSIIYHELLHHVLGPWHNRRFHQRERKFREYQQAREWLRRNLLVLLGRAREGRSQARRRDVTKAGPVQLTLFG